MPRSNRTTVVLLGIIVAVLIGWVLHVGASILQPLVIALLLASMLQPVVRTLARVGIPPVLTGVALTGLMFFGLARLGILLESNIDILLAPGGEAAAEDPSLPPEDRAVVRRGGWEGLVEGLAKKVEDSAMPEQIKSYFVSTLQEIDPAEIAPELVGGGFSFTKGLMLVVIYMLFIFAEQAVFRRKILSIAGERHADAAEVLSTIGRGVQRYLGVKTIVSLATGALCYAGLVILDVPFAPLWGALTFLLNYIPTFGSIVAGALPTLTVLGDGAEWGKAVAVVILYLAVNTALGTILEPRILGRELNLSPLVVVISVVVWAGIWGVVGSFLAVPLTSILTIILANQETTRPIAIMLSSGKGLEHDPPAKEFPPPRVAAEAREKSA